PSPRLSLRCYRQLLGDQLCVRFRSGLDGDANGHAPSPSRAMVAGSQTGARQASGYRKAAAVKLLPGFLAGEPAAAHAHVREEQDDEDDCEDDPNDHDTPILVEMNLSCEVSSGSGLMSPPSGGSDPTIGVCEGLYRPRALSTAARTISSGV